jgi:hypothetical protein
MLGTSVARRVKADADVLLFTDGERLTGHFVKSSGAALTFKSDARGEITVDWSKVKRLQSSVKVAVIPKGVRLRKRQVAANIPQGTLAVCRIETRAWQTAPNHPGERCRTDYRAGWVPERAI